MGQPVGSKADEPEMTSTKGEPVGSKADEPEARSSSTPKDTNDKESAGT